MWTERMKVGIGDMMKLDIVRKSNRIPFKSDTPFGFRYFFKFFDLGVVSNR